MKIKYIIPIAFLTGLLLCSNLHAQIYVANSGNNNGDSIGEFTLAGTPVPAGSGTLATGLDQPYGLAISGSDIFVADFGDNALYEYTTAGTLVGPGALISSGLPQPTAIAISGSDIFVTNDGDNVNEYTTAGAAVNSGTLISEEGNNLMGIAISGSNMFLTNANSGFITQYTTTGSFVGDVTTDLNRPVGIAVSGSDLFVVNNGNNTIAEYTISGTTVTGSNTSLVSSGLNYPTGIAISGSDLFITGGSNSASSAIYEYTTTGGTVGSGTLVSTDLHSPFGIVVVPEPSTWAMLGIGAAGLVTICRRKRVKA